MFFINHTDIAEGTAAIIEIEGSLNSESSPDFDDYLSKLAENRIIYLLIDMKNLKFISSEGIGAILVIQKSIKEKNGMVVFFNLNYEISSLFKLLGFDKVITIAADRAEALNILDRHMELFPPETSSPVFDDIDDDEEFIPDTKHDAVEFSEDETDSFNAFDGIEENPTRENSIEPFVIECMKCRSLIRVRESGDQLCPYCSAEFTVTDDNKAVFKIKEIP